MYIMREGDCSYSIVVQTDGVGLHSKRHPIGFDVSTRPFASFSHASILVATAAVESKNAFIHVYIYIYIHMYECIL